MRHCNLIWYHTAHIRLSQWKNVSIMKILLRSKELRQRLKRIQLQDNLVRWIFSQSKNRASALQFLHNYTYVDSATKTSKLSQILQRDLKLCHFRLYFQPNSKCLQAIRLRSRFFCMKRKVMINIDVCAWYTFVKVRY